MSDNAQGQTDSGMPECMNVEELEQHRWLARFVGDWSFTARMQNPDGSEHVTQGSESVSMLGDIWFVADGQGEMPDGGSAKMRMTVGYDPARGKFVGSWIGTMMLLHWVYEGQLSEDGNSLHLVAEGPDFSGGNSTRMYRDTIEYVSDDFRRLRSAMQAEDGSWQEFNVAEYHRVK
ncbi:MAG: DUF1579 domain-containing protein [Planctomycetales bacterium]|nr:DUF1579 domain-containing protein [bacterium]UNM08881.1 MAG: DUF1579 domain-containing protein [Planctomycetales bacterium]